MKRLIAVILTFVVVLVFSGCQNIREFESNDTTESNSLTNIFDTAETDSSTEVETSRTAESPMEEAVLKAAINISDSDEVVCRALENHIDENYLDEIDAYMEAIKLLKDAQDEIKKFSIDSSKSQLIRANELLIANYETTVYTLRDMITNGYTNENVENYNTLMNSAININQCLYEYSQAFANLYNIRSFDISSGDGVEGLEDNWWKFNFIGFAELMPSDIESYDKTNLYTRWAFQFNENYEGTEEFDNELQNLRKNDELTPEYNEKWCDFMRKYIFNQKIDKLIDDIYERDNSSI